MVFDLLVVVVIDNILYRFTTSLGHIFTEDRAYSSCEELKDHLMHLGVG